MTKIIEMTGAEYKAIVKVCKGIYIGSYMPLFQYVQVHPAIGGIEFRVSNGDEEVRTRVAYDHSDHDEFSGTFGIPLDVFCGMKCGVRDRVIITDSTMSAAGVSIRFNPLPADECPDSVIWVDTTWRRYPDLRFAEVAERFTDPSHDKFKWINVYQDGEGIYAVQNAALYAVNHRPKKVVLGSIASAAAKIMRLASDDSEYSVAENVWRIEEPCHGRGMDRIRWEFRGKLHHPTVVNIDRVLEQSTSFPAGRYELIIGQEGIRRMQEMCPQLLKLGMPRKNGHLSGAVRIRAKNGSGLLTVEYVALDGRTVDYSMEIPMITASFGDFTSSYDIDHWNTCLGSIVRTGVVKFMFDSVEAAERATIITTDVGRVLLMPYKLK